MADPTRKAKLRELKQQKRYEDALLQLEYWISSDAERYAPIDDWTFLQACTLLRKFKRYQDEASLVDRFMERWGPHNSPDSRKIWERAEETWALAGLIEERTVDGQPFRFHKVENVRLDERSIFLRDAIVLDTETTGFSSTDEVIELAMLRFRYSRYSGRIIGIVGEYRGFREPSCGMSPQAARKHHITLDELRGQQLDREKILALVDGVGHILAHNAPFDCRFITPDFPELHRPYWVCTMNGIGWLDKGCPSRKLEDICSFHGLQHQAHCAESDARVIVSLLSQTDNRSGRTLLAELLAL